MSESQGSPDLYNRMKVKSVARQTAYQPRQFVSDLNFNGRDPKAPVRWTQAPITPATPKAPVLTPAVAAAPAASLQSTQAVAPVQAAPAPRPIAPAVVATPTPAVAATAAPAAAEPAAVETAFLETPVHDASSKVEAAPAVSKGLGLEEIEPVVSRPKVVIVAKSGWASKLEHVRNFGDKVDLSDSKLIDKFRKLSKRMGKLGKKAAKTSTESVAATTSAAKSVSISAPKMPAIKVPTVKMPAKLGQMNLTQWILGSAAAVVFTVGAVAGFQAQTANHQAGKEQVAALAEPKPVPAAPSPAPAEQAPVQPVVTPPVVEPVAAKRPTIDKPTNEAINQYSVNPDQPRTLKIPAIGVNARIGQVGLESDGELAKPGNVYDAAWYTASAKPGPPGAVLLNGYTASGETPGVFHDLGKLVANDTLQVERGDGAVMTYKVVRIEHIMAGKLDLRAAVTPVMAGRPGLNLVTASDDSKTGVMVVYAQQIQ